MSDRTVVSPSIHEMVIARHMKGDDDQVLSALHDGVKTAREMCLKAGVVTEKVLANTMKTEPMRHKEARDASFALVERATTALDTAMKQAQTEIQTLKARISAPPPTKDMVSEARQRELRERLTALPEDKRRQILDAAAAEGDDQLIGSVLSVPPWLSGISKTDLDMIRHHWAKTRYPADLERLDRLERAVADAQRAGVLSISFVDHLTDAKMIEDAEALAKAANDALREAKGA